MRWRAPWLSLKLEKLAFFSLSGSTPLQDVIQVNTYPVHILVSSHLCHSYLNKSEFFFTFSLHESNLITRNFTSASLVNASLHLWLWNDPLIVSFISATFCSDCSSAMEGELLHSDVAFVSCRPQKQWPSPLFQTCLSKVITVYFPRHPFTQGQSKRRHFFVTKVVSVAESFQHWCICTNGTTSAVSCVTMASDCKPLNYFTLSRGTKEDTELF